MPSVQLYLQAVPDCKSIVIVVIRFLSGDLGTTSLEVWKDEVLDQSIEVNNLVYKLPLILRYSVLPKNVVSQILLFVNSNMLVNIKANCVQVGFRLADAFYGKNCCGVSVEHGGLLEGTGRQCNQKTGATQGLTNTKFWKNFM